MAEELTRSDPAATNLSQLHSIKSASVCADGVAANPSKSVRRLKIAMLVVGTRGDVQPFIAVAKKLQASIYTLVLLSEFYLPGTNFHLELVSVNT